MKTKTIIGMSIIIVMIILMMNHTVEAGIVITSGSTQISQSTINQTITGILSGIHSTTGKCDNTELCHPKEGFNLQWKEGKRFKARTNDEKCTITRNNLDQKCKGSNSNCICYDLESLGQCDTNINSSCEGPAEISNQTRTYPCQCGKGEFTDQKSDYCIASAGKVYNSKADCIAGAEKISSCSQRTINQTGGGKLKLYCQPPNENETIAYCKGEPCGDEGQGICNERAECVEANLKPNNYCEMIPGFRCLNMVFEAPTLARAEMLFDKKEGKFLLHKGNRGGTVGKFPNEAVLKEANDGEHNFSKLVDGWKNILSTEGFYNTYVNDKSFRETLCGVSAADDSRSTDPSYWWDLQCGKITPIYCAEGGILENILTGATDPTSMTLTELGGISESYDNALGEYGSNWTTEEWFGNWTSLSDGLCEQSIRGPGLSNQIINDLGLAGYGGQISVALNGFRSPILPDNTTLYEISWMIQNKRNDEEGLTFSVEVFDQDTGKYAYVKDGSEKMFNQSLGHLSTSYGYYSFYFNQSILFDQVRIKQDSGIEQPIYSNPIVDENYDDTYTFNPGSENNNQGGGSGNNDGGDDGNEVDI